MEAQRKTKHNIHETRKGGVVEVNKGGNREHW